MGGEKRKKCKKEKKVNFFKTNSLQEMKGSAEIIVTTLKK
jgi:hypothetical protein